MADKGSEKDAVQHFHGVSASCTPHAKTGHLGKPEHPQCTVTFADMPSEEHAVVAAEGRTISGCGNDPNSGCETTTYSFTDDSR